MIEEIMDIYFYIYVIIEEIMDIYFFIYIILEEPSFPHPPNFYAALFCVYLHNFDAFNPIRLSLIN